MRSSCFFPFLRYSLQGCVYLYRYLSVGPFERNPSPFDVSRLSSKSACLYKLRCTDGERNGNSDKEETQEKTNAREKFFYRRLLHTISSLTDKLFFLDRQASYCERQFQQLTFFPNLHARLHLVFFLSFLFPVACTLSSFRPGFLVSFFTLFSCVIYERSRPRRLWRLTLAFRKIALHKS